MKRRRFLSLSGLGGLTVALRPLFGAPPAGATEGSASSSTSPEEFAEIDPYFLDSGEVTPAEREAIEDLVQYQELMARGEPAIRPRGRPKHAPTYRFLHWKGDIGDPQGQFVGPLSVRPALAPSDAYHLNAQILGFHLSSQEWPGKRERGTITIEFRGFYQGDSITWLYAQQFDVFEGGAPNVGFEYVAQRNGVPSPVVTDQPNVDLRIQLLRHKKKSRFLRTLLKTASFISGIPTGGTLSDPATALRDSMPEMRVPQMLPEGVAFSQAMFAGVAEETPLWRSGFSSYGIAAGGSRLGISTGFWVAIDESRQLDLRGVLLEDVGGSISLTRDGEPVDANYLVLMVEVSVGQRLGFRPGSPPDDTSGEDQSETPDEEGAEEVVPKGVPPQDE